MGKKKHAKNTLLGTVVHVNDETVLKELREEERKVQKKIGEELPKDEASLGVIDLTPTQDDALSQKQKQQRDSYWFWWRK
jgi:hypothetical protein